MKQFFDDGMHLPSPYGIRLIKGSHIVVPRVHTQKQAYILQNEDKRIVFVIPWMDEFSIIGTTDVEYKGDPKNVEIDESEVNYLLKVYNAHFKKQLSRDDVVWTYSGVRPLCDDESDSPQAITRDYTLDIHDVDGQAPLLSVFGGKLTTYRKLAEHALEKLAPYYKGIGPALAAADVGIAMGTGTDVAIESAGVTLLKGDLMILNRARHLSEITMKNIRQNLFFAFIYNALGVPVAAGLLYPVYGILLSPVIAAAAMALSSVSVIANALRLKSVRLGK